MAETTIRPDSTISSTEVRDESGGTTNLHDGVNDQSDSTYTHTLHNSTDAECFLGLANLPADAATNDPVTAIVGNVRYRQFRDGASATDDDILLEIEVQSSAGTPYTSKETVFNFTDGGTTGSWTDSGNINFTLLTAGQNASEADWNSARVWLDWTYSKTKGPDPCDIDVSDVAFTITYDTAAAAPHSRRLLVWLI